MKHFVAEVLGIYFICLGWTEKDGVGDSESRQ